MHQNTFPRFNDGDVQIRLSDANEDVLILHSFVLGLHSPFFKASLSERWAGGTGLLMGSTNIKFNYEMKFDEGGVDGILVRQAHYLLGHDYPEHWILVLKNC